MLLSHLVLWSALVLALPATPFCQQPDADTEAGIALLDHAGLAARLSALANAQPDRASLSVLGRSRAGREIHALRLSSGEPPAGRPAILVVAGLEGTQVFSSAIALFLAERIAADEAARALLEDTTLYIVPRANPDATEARFETPRQERAASGYGVDDDRDGRSGEDGPADVDGDGVVARLRLRDPEGTWIVDPTDERAMTLADAAKGQRGEWKLFVEGRDGDGDEAVGEDPLLDAEVNRNFPAGWQQHTPRAGLFPTDEPETRALADFLLQHPDIALVLTLGLQDNLTAKPKKTVKESGRSRRPPEPGVLEGDAELLERLGERYRVLTDSDVKGEADDAGSFQRWVYEHRGLLALNVRPWDIPLDGDGKKKAADDSEETDGSQRPKKGEKSDDARKGKPCDDARRLKWIDAAGEEARFLAWRPFEHPELGPVEIGGFAPFARHEPPQDAQAAIAEAQLAFLLTLGADLPRLALVDCRATALGGGLLEVTAVLENTAFLPFTSRSGRRTRTQRPARVRLRLPQGATLLAGRRQSLVSDLAGCGGREELHWLVRGAEAAEVTIEVDSDHAGTASAQPEVQP